MIPGIDISHHQGEIDWEKLSESPVKFVFMKVSQGGDFIDLKFGYNQSYSRQYNIPWGGYHFFEPGIPGAEQARRFLTAYHDWWKHPSLPPVLDVEKSDGTNIESGVKNFLTTVEETTGRTPIIYTGPAFWKETFLPDPKKIGKNINSYVWETDFSRYPLWVADYRGHGFYPEVPEPWSDWTFHQFTDKGTVPGIVGPVNLDYFQGNIFELKETIK